MSQLWWWFLHLTGADNVSGTFYGFWSGFGSDLGEIAIVGGLVSIYRKHTCEVAGCWRLQRHRTEGGHIVCRRHHPDGEPSAEDVHRLHREAKSR